MSGHAGGNSESVKPPVHPDIPEDDAVPLTGADQGNAGAESNADERASNTQQRRTSTGTRE